MDCKGCGYYRYEPETDFKYCIKTPFELGRMELSVCPDYYNVADVKADHKESLKDGQRDD